MQTHLACFSKTLYFISPMFLLVDIADVKGISFLEIELDTLLRSYIQRAFGFLLYINFLSNFQKKN